MSVKVIDSFRIMNFQKGGASVGQVVADADNDTLTIIGGPGVNFGVDENSDAVTLSLQSAEDIVASAIGRVEIRADDSTVRIVQGGESLGILGDGGLVSTSSNAEGDITIAVDNDLSNYDNSVTAFISNINNESIDDLNDVVLSGITDGELLQWSSGSFINRTITEAGFAAVSTTGSYNDLSNRPNLTFDGDLSGNTGGVLAGGASTITLTLDNVNSNVGTFNTVTVNAKGLVTSASNVNFATVATSGSYNDLLDLPSLAGTYKFNIAADDSTEEQINSDETVQIAGGTNITTSLNDGVITVTGPSNLSQLNNDVGYITVDQVPQTFSFSVGADDSTLRNIGAGESFNIIGGTNITTSSDAEGNITITGPTLTSYVQQGDTFTGDVIGSVFADDSTMLVDAVAGKIVGAVQAPNITSASYIDAGTSVNATGFGSVTPGNFINLGTNASSINVVTDIDMLTYSITNASNISANTLTGDLTGSVFADDSTLLVDGVAGKIVGDVQNTTVATDSVTTNGLVVNGSARIGAHWPFSDGSDDIGTSSNRYGDIYAVNVFANVNGDLTGSVVADDSTVLIDGVAGKIVGPIEVSSLKADTILNLTTTLNLSTLSDDIVIDSGASSTITLRPGAGGISISSSNGVNINNTGIGTINIGHSTNQTNFAGTVDFTNATITNAGFTTESYVDNAIANLIDSAPGALDTLNELAAALNDDANFAATVTTRFTNIENNVFAIGADDSTLRTVKQGEGIKIIGGTNLTTSSDAEGNITVDFVNPGYITAGLESGDNVSELVNDAGYFTRLFVAGDDSTVRTLVKDETIQFQGTGSTTTSTDADGNVIIDSGNETITLFGDVTGSGTTSINVTLADSPIAAGTYNRITFDTKGIAQSGQLIDYLEPGTGVSQLTNDAGYLTNESAINFDVVGDDSTGFNVVGGNKIQLTGTNGITVTAAQDATMPTVTIDLAGGNISTFTNDVGYYKAGSSMVGDLTGSVFSETSTRVIDGQTGNLYGSLFGDVVGNVTGDLTGSVVADDSTPLIDGVAGKIVGDVATGNLKVQNSGGAIIKQQGSNTENNFVHIETVTLTNITSYQTIFTITPADTTNIWCRGLVTFTGAGHESSGGNGAVHRAVQYFDVDNNTFTAGSVSTGDQSGTYFPDFQVIVSGNSFLVQVKSNGGSNRFDGVGHFEIFVPRTAGTATTWTIT